MKPLHYILATAGHVDHGKSSLVHALTGIDPDRLPEEKARGITIELGFAHLELSASRKGEPVQFHLGIVDVPGHEDFVKNMVAGVGSIDVALIVVAADDGWMPQTEEHLQILEYLGVTRAVIALTKIDLAANEGAEAREQIRARLANSAFSAAPVIGTSVRSTRGLEELKSALAQVLLETPAPRDFGKPRLPVDRVFTLHGIGTIVTGTLSGGSFERNQPAIIQPGGHVTRIRGIQSHNHAVEAATPGMRTALNLPDVTPFREAGRGSVITLPELGAPSKTWDVLLERSNRRELAIPGSTRPIKSGARVRVHFGSGNLAGNLFLIDGKTLDPGAHTLAELQFDEPAFAFAGDRFVIRDWQEQATLAGGLVLDPDAAREHFRSPAQRTFLETRAAAPDSASAFVESALLRDGIVERKGLLLKSRFAAAQIQDALQRLATEKRAVLHSEIAAEGNHWRALLEHGRKTVIEFHRAHPDSSGLPLNDLRAALAPFLSLPQVFENALRDLCAAGFVQTGSAIREKSFRPALPPELQSAGVRLRARLAQKPFDPPSRKELAPDPASEQALRFLLRTGEAVEASPETIFLADNFAKARDLITIYLRANGGATASELRQALQTSRRVIIPLLEYLDKQGVTRREGDRRIAAK